MTTEAGKAVDVNSVMDAMALTEEQVAAEAGKFNEDGSPKEVVTEEAKADAGAESKEARILAADGVHTLPFKAIQDERDRADRAARAEQEATQRAADLQTQLEALQKKAAAGGQTDDEVAATDDALAEIKGQVDAIRGDLPAMAGVFDKLVGTVEALQAKVSRTEQAENERATATEQHVAEARTETAKLVRAAIDKNPHLSLWETEDGKAFDKAVEFDEMLKADPNWKGKSFDDRFAHAVKLTLVDLPEAKQPTKALTPEQVKERAEKIVADAGRKAGSGEAIDSISDLPGGASPGSDALENVEAMPAASLANRMDKMSPAQLENFMSRFG